MKLIGISNFEYTKSVDEIIKNWSKLGFTNGLSGDMLTYVCLAFERGAMVLLRPKFNHEWEHEYVYYRVIRRVMCFIDLDEGNKYFRFDLTDEERRRRKDIALKYFDVEMIADELNLLFNDFRKMIRNINTKNNEDFYNEETEAIDNFSNFVGTGICRHFSYVDIYELDNGKTLLISK